MDSVSLRKTGPANKARDVVGSDANVAQTVPALRIEQLLDGFREIRLLHGREEYRLRLTRNNKLILTK